MASVEVPEYIVIPMTKRVLIKKDDNKKATRSGLILPDSAEIPVITGRVVELSPDLENDYTFPIKKYDKVLINPQRAIPVEFDNDNKLFIIPSEDLVAVFKKAVDD